MAHTAKQTYLKVVRLASLLAMKIEVNWDTNDCVVIPRGLSAELNGGRAFKVNLGDVEPDAAAEKFGRHFRVPQDRITELLDGTSPTLTRRSRKETPHGRKVKHPKEGETSRKGARRPGS